MSRMSIATPCPAPNTLSGLPIPIANRRASIASNSTSQDETVELEYTRAIEVNLKHAPPRRRSTFYKRPKKDAPVAIFEDVIIEDEELVVPERTQIAGPTLLGKPAQKPHGHAVRRQGETEAHGQDAPQHRRRVSSIVPRASILEHERENQPPTEQYALTQHPKEQVRGGLVKEPRRRTIFIPGEDTTIMTIHPGANATTRLDDTFRAFDFETQRLDNPHQQPEAREQRKRPRMSLAAAPKRVPLQQMAAKEINAAGVDVPGRNTGKENTPPKSKPQIQEKRPTQPVQPRVPAQAMSRSTLFEPTAASRARQSLMVRDAVPLVDHQVCAQVQRPAQSPVVSRAKHLPQDARPRLSLRPSPPRLRAEAEPAEDFTDVNNFREKRKSFVPRLSVSERQTELKSSRLQQYPILSENLAQPELYEDSWLTHQEIALTELVNQIFRSAEPKQKPWQGQDASLRQRMVQLYHRPQVTTLHRRLKASLLCGALSLPKDLSSPPPNPAQDIGLRKRFISLWLETYNTEFLSVAAEVVFGREMPATADGSNGMNQSTMDPHKSRRALIRFLETFLVEVADVEDADEERGDEPYGHWRKMILRSLMLVWLLDQAKTFDLVHGCLFRAESTRKTSVAVLQGLATMLMPSTGEITRVLRHLDYEVVHTQDPLDEMKWRLDNIAVDLRNGILLTKLVEILLFSQSRIKHMNPTGDATVTIRMPDLTILESTLYNAEESRAPCILSQHLKMPCLGRAQKVYNVQIALSTLKDHGGLVSGASDVAADDIVDGHREKTLSLLWLLASNHGLEELVDFRELATDIRRTAGTSFDVPMDSVEDGCISQGDQESLLKKWASTYALRNGIRVGNLTTSFADGKVYSAILDAYAEYLGTGNQAASTASSSAARVDIQLRALGCSKAFRKQMRTATGTIPSRKTTISNLAFLASRLLPLARQHNAARTIQRAFRRRRWRSVVSQRVALMRLAYACATVVGTQQRLIAAATVLQRAWRNVLDVRVKRLNANVETFQIAARGWLVRRKCRRAMSVQPSRIMAGW